MRCAGGSTVRVSGARAIGGDVGSSREASTDPLAISDRDEPRARELAAEHVQSSYERVLAEYVFDSPDSGVTHPGVA